MERPKGWAQKTVILAGIILSCVSQPGAEQQKVSVVLEPPYPQAGEDVNLLLRGGPQQIKLCEWYRVTRKGQPESILEYILGPSPQQRNGTARSGRETVRGDCSLRITKLRSSDTGNYSIILEGVPARQESGQRPGQQPDEFYEGFVYLEVSAPERISIPIRAVPPEPHLGQEVALTPQGTFHEIVFCEWFREGSPENDYKPIIQFRPRDQQSPQSGGAAGHARVTVGPDCSLRMTQLAAADSGTYAVQMQVLLDRQQQQPGQGARPQEPGAIQEYRGEVELRVNQASSTDQQYSKSAGLRYSVEIVAGAFLVFFAWTDAFTALFHVLCSASPN